MLQEIGDALKGKKILALLVMAPLVLVFAVWGAVGIVSTDLISSQAFAAKVNGNRIELAQVNDSWRDQQSRWQQQVGTEIPEATRISLQDGVLEQSIRNELITERSRLNGYRVAAVRVLESIRTEPAFQVEGKYNETLALARLSQLNIQADQFRVDVRSRLQTEELQRALGISEFMTAPEIGRRLALEDEQREVRVVLLPIARYSAAVSPDEPTLGAWYKTNAKQFLSTETVQLQFAELTLAGVSNAVTVSEIDLQALYAKNKNRYIEPERRRARHILIRADKGEAAAKTQAQSVLDRLRAGEDFATVAKQISQDIGSAQEGGDLGFAERTTFVGPFADAVFGMKEGELRGPVKTEFGYHLIRLEGVQAGRSKAFEEARAVLETEFRRDRASDIFGDQQEQIQRRLEQPGADIASIAKDFKMNLGQVDQFARGTGGGVLGADAAVNALVFSDAVLTQRRLGGPVAVGEERLVVLKVIDHKKPTVPALNEIRGKVLQAHQQALGALAAQAAAAAAAKQLNLGSAFDQISQSLGATTGVARFVDRRDSTLAPEVRQSVFAAQRPVAGKPQAVSVVLADGGAAVVLITQARTTAPSGNNAERSSRLQELLVREGQSTVAAYVAEMRRAAKVEKNPKAFQ
ncbi:MAG: hypothetical protein EXR88_03760 [Gammaproteobacteria bacterium]|nr:hypothetical protein [Gammaproteobacteria bacterium]